MSFISESPSLFERSACPVDRKLTNYAKYVRRQPLARTLALYELFKLQVGVKGSIVECGVHHGGGLMAWAKFSSILEPYNYRRKIFGFDTFEGFPDVTDLDRARRDMAVGAGTFKEDYDVFGELTEAIAEYDENRFLNHIPKVILVKGDANETIPRFLEDQPHVLVSLLYMDFDIYQPTVTALKHFVPRMPKGAILAFDEINNENWPGETVALLEQLTLRDLRVQCFEFEPNISYVQL